MTHRILVTGAGGFIGGHIVEYLSRDPQFKVTATSQTSGARFARLGVPFVAGNPADRTFARSITASVDVVVHCAFGPGVDEPEHLRTFLAAAAENGVRTFVHLSTVEVYANHKGDVGEDAPRHAAGATYGAIKARLEGVIEEASSLFSSVVVLRPAIVYGPASTHWVVRPLMRVIRAGWRPDFASMTGTCNPVHVTDLARVVKAASIEPAPGLSCYNIVGPDVMSWAEYYSALLPNARTGAPPANQGMRARMRSIAARAGRSIPRPLRRAILDGAKKIPGVDLYIDGLRRTNLASADPLEVELITRRVTYSTNALRAVGWEPVIHFDAGIEHTLSWARSMGLLGDAPTARNLLEERGEVRVSTSRL